VVAAAGPLAPVERHQHTRQRLQRADDIRHRHAGYRRHPVAAQGDADRAGERHGGEVVRRAVSVRAILAEGADGAVDDARVHLRYGSIVHAEAPHHAGPVGLHEYVGCLAQPEEAWAALVRLEVDDNALLAAVDIAEEHGARPVRYADTATRVATRRLHLDDAGAVVGQ